MKIEDLNLIESALGIALPGCYRSAALDNRFQEPIHDDAQSIIAINRSFRNGDYGDEQWPPSLFAMGHDGAGNYFCIDVDHADKGVLLRDHETQEISPCAESIAEWLEEWQRS